MNELRDILKMVQVVQCECFGTEVTIAIFTNQKYFSVHVQRADRSIQTNSIQLKHWQ